MSKKIDIDFTCYRYIDHSGYTYTLFFFSPNDEWNEDELRLEEALKRYPPEKYNWIQTDDDEELL